MFSRFFLQRKKYARSFTLFHSPLSLPSNREDVQEREGERIIDQESEEIILPHFNPTSRLQAAKATEGSKLKYR